MSNADTLASTLASSFTTDERTDGTAFTKLRPDSPLWVKDAVREAHGDSFPDDWKYEACARVASALAEALEYEHDVTVDEIDTLEICDSLVDIYTTALTAWLASHLDRIGFVDQALDDGIVTADDGIVPLLSAGQYVEYQEIAGAFIEAIREREEEEEDV